MLISALAKRVGTSTRALRHYEALGLLAARRTSNGYREYDEADVAVVREIRTLVGIGFALEETRPFVECLRAGYASGDSCPASVAVYRRKIAEIDDCVASLAAVRARLTAAVDGDALVGADAPEPLCAFTPLR
ncbi:MerR family transcriptional regulator [Cryptosporangium aurantiacum]|uniref:DNA-binding transcriptional regulator, MerR family n=1 Tax=Cryptosporangium aurantiacum TaxID=134849 RepID=A0A1M7NQ23_9ACTN|nr:MerR family transcriptional regulator [Cryptosporangium aurantiacum]SHN05957.1 DNA-binding transcriptional regulator, MerR family [Cryptosporangium aurantiacum]